MFLSISGHSSEISIANHSPRSTVSQLKCVSDTISSWSENHQPQKTKISSVIYTPFIQNWVDRNHKFSKRIFSTPVIFRATSKLFGSQGCSDEKTDKISQFNFAFTVSFHSLRNNARVRFDSGAIFLDQSWFFATHSNQWNCFILNRS